MDTSTSDVVDPSLMEPVYEKYKDEPGALLPVLEDAQALYGFLRPAILQSIADRFGITLGKVYSVATYYSQLHFEPRGSHVLQLCDGTVCHLQGASALAAAVKEAYGIEPGETTHDGQLTVETVYCLGACALAPAAMLDGEVIGNVHPDELLNEIERRLRQPPETPAVGDESPGSAA